MRIFLAAWLVVFITFSCIQHLGLTAADSIPVEVVPYDLDVLPKTFPALIQSTDKAFNKHIPRQIWMAVKDIKEELPGHIQAFLKKNSLWTPNICDNDCKDLFINTTFAGTVLLWQLRNIKRSVLAMIK